MKTTKNCVKKKFIEKTPWNLKELYKVPKMFNTDHLNIEGFKSFFYEGLDYKGSPVRVYSYYKAPSGTRPEGGWPAVVLVHGGGGTAFYQWVQKWVDKGFAAISMDLEGHMPYLNIEHNKRPQHDNSGPARTQKAFDDYQIPFEEQWFYHAVADVVCAHSLVASFPEINPDKIGMMGVSWGAIIANVVSGVDTTFGFIIPVYGTAYLYCGDGILLVNRERIDHYEPSLYIPYNYSPTLYVNGTNDLHFPLDNWQKTTELVKGPVTRYIGINMMHGHGNAWNLNEPYVFAKSIVNGEMPLAKVGKLSQNGDIVSMEYSSELSISKIELCFTIDKGKHSEREWKAKEVDFLKGKVETQLPERTSAYYLNITDKRDYISSSEYIEVN